MARWRADSQDLAKLVVKCQRGIEDRFGRRVNLKDLAPYFGRKQSSNVSDWFSGKALPSTHKTASAIKRLDDALEGRIPCPAGFKDPVADRPLMLAWHAEQEAMRVAAEHRIDVAGTPKSGRSDERLSNGRWEALDVRMKQVELKLGGIEVALNQLLVEWRGTRKDAA